MFGLPDPDAEMATAKLDRHILEVEELIDQAREDGAWPWGGQGGVIFLLNERVSPKPIRWRDHTFLIAILFSLLFHVGLILQLRANGLVAHLVKLSEEARLAQLRAQQKEEIVPFYEFVETPNKIPEKSARRNAPGSDLDRRAHGGEGAPSNRPGSRGNTPELRIVPPQGQQGEGGGAPILGEADKAQGKANEGAGQDERTTRQNQEKDARESDDGDQTRPTPAPLKVVDAGADAVLAQPKNAGASPGGRLRGLGGVGTPGGMAGLMPNRPGGQVDLGPLSFDTQWFEWGPYAAEMLRRIRYHWDIPEIAQLGVGGVVRIRFYIERDGRVTGLEIQNVSGHPSMDFAARDAILRASPLPPLPSSLPGDEHEGVTITFYYNTPIPENTENG